MEDARQSREELIAELTSLRQRVADLEEANAASGEDVCRLPFLQTFPFGVHCYNLMPDGRLIFSGANPAADHILGVDNSQFVGRTIEEAFPPLARTEIPARYRDVAAGASPWYGEQISYQDEKIAGAFEVHAWQVAPGRMAAAFRSIFERKMLEEDLRCYRDSLEALVSEQHSELKRTSREYEQVQIALNRESRILHSLIALNPYSIAIYDIDGRFVRGNQAYMDLFKAEPSPGYSLFTEPSLIERFPDELRRLQDGATVDFSEGWYSAHMINPDLPKDYALVRAKGFPIKDAEGRPEFFVIIHENITDRWLAEQALRESEERFRRMAEQIQDGLTIVENNTITYVNQKALDIFGVTRERFVNMSVLELVVPEEREQVRQQRREIEEAGWDGREIEYWIIRPDGARRCIQSRYSASRRDGEIVGRYVVTTDITERKTDEQALQEAYQQLQTLDRLKNEFIASISHELRTPLTNLRLYHHLLTARPDHLASYTQVLGQEINRLENLVESVFYLSRLERGDIEFTPENRDLNTVAGPIVAGHMEEAAGRGLTLTFSGAPDLPAVRIDATLMQRLISILLTNALLYTPAGGAVHVHTHIRSSDGIRRVGLSIRDTGPGILPTEMPRLFERFFRGQASLDTGTPGAGLGLAITRQIIERHRGYIDVLSQAGKGTTFTVWLPEAV